MKRLGILRWYEWIQWFVVCLVMGGLWYPVYNIHGELIDWRRAFRGE